MKLYDLFIDELGHSNPLSKQSEVYILCGCVVPADERSEIKTRADQIKFKYWGNTNVVFHSRDIGNNGGDFVLFKGSRTRKDEFLKDLINFLKYSNFYVFVIAVDKDLSKAKGWNEVKIIKETARKLFYHFIAWLLAKGGSQGRIHVESATSEKDRHYLNEFSYFLSPGCKELSVDFKIIQNILTSISFVTKRNHDIEEQITDLFAYAARCKFMRLTKKETYKLGTYEDRIIKILETKLFQKPQRAKEKKMKF